jgi:hypothetical protein
MRERVQLTEEQSRTERGLWARFVMIIEVVTGRPMKAQLDPSSKPGTFERARTHQLIKPMTDKSNTPFGVTDTMRKDERNRSKCKASR